jgi:iron complex outermembrane recepter protein
VTAAIFCPVTNAEAREAGSQQIDISATDLSAAIAELSRKAHVSIGTAGSLPQLRTSPIHGEMTAGEALTRLLSGSGYTARRVGGTAWRIEPLPRTRPVKVKIAPSFIPPAAPIIPQQIIESPPIIVTGTKRSRPLNELPLAISVVSLSADNKAATSRDTAKIAASMEGLALTGLGPGRNRLAIRGVADSSFNGESQSTVAVLLDDARLTYSAPDPNIRLVDVERVEVIKGPQGSLFGSGALGGIYHIVSRRADVNRFELEASAGTETVAHGGIGYSGSVIANVPVVSGTAALRLVGYSAIEPGWVDTGDRKDSNKTQVSGLRAGLGIAAGGGWRFDLAGVAQWQNSGDSQYVYAPGARKRPMQIAEPHDNDLRHIAARIARPASDNVDILLSSGMTWHEVGDVFDATIGAESFGLANVQSLTDNRKYRLWDNELRFNGNLGKLDWLIGLSYIRSSQNILGKLNASNGASLIVDDDRRTSHDVAIFSDFIVPLGAQFKLDAGARLFRNMVKETRVLPSGIATHDHHRSGITPSLALSWQPGHGQLGFIRYGSANRQGGSDINSAGQFEILKSDELATIEAGWREEFSDGAHFDLGIHYSWWKNLQSDQLKPNGLIETENAGNAEIFGGELSFTKPLSKNWTAEGGASFTMAKLVSNSLGIELVDRHLPIVPEYTLRASISHDFAVGKADGNLRFNTNYLGPSRLSFDPALDRPMGNLFDSGIEGNLKLNQFTLSIAGSNLLGRRSDGFAFGNSLRFASSRQYTPQQPQTLSISLHVALR